MKRPIAFAVVVLLASATLAAAVTLTLKVTSASIAHGMAVPSAAEGAIKDAVSQFWNTDKMTAKDAMDKIAAAAKMH